MRSNEDLLRIKLSSDPLMSTALRSNYDCSVIHDALRGLLLSPCGAHQTGPNPDDCYLTLCAGCCKAICKKGKTTPPKLAIANGFAIGTLPTQFANAQRAKILLVKLVRPQGWICYCKAKVENGIKGIFFDKTCLLIFWIFLSNFPQFLRILRTLACGQD